MIKKQTSPTYGEWKEIGSIEPLLDGSEFIVYAEPSSGVANVNGEKAMRMEKEKITKFDLRKDTLNSQ